MTGHEQQQRQLLERRERIDEDSEWCVLCGQAPMPIVVELPDGCVAHPGCATDPAFVALIEEHRRP